MTLLEEYASYETVDGISLTFNGHSVFFDLRREEIDLLSAREVYWDPYKDVRDIRPLDDVTFFNGVLCVLDIAEGYNIDRVLRQVRYVQRILGMPIQPKYGSKNTNVRYNVNHYTFSRLWMSGNNHVLSKFERGERVVASSDCVNRYIDWFNNISHPHMRNPKHFSQVHRLPPVNWELIVTEATRLLKESLDIGGTQDVHGMLAREKMIYNILQFQQIIQESSQSRCGGENSGDVGENSGGGQDNGGDGGENSGDNMDIDTTKIAWRTTDGFVFVYVGQSSPYKDSIETVLSILRFVRLSRRSEKSADGLFLTEASKDKPSIELVIKGIFNHGHGRCCVCLGDFELKEQLHQIPSCKHLFHIDCIHHWLKANFTRPLCRCYIFSTKKLNAEPPLLELITRDEDKEEEIEEEDYTEEEEADYEEHDGEEGGLVDELCEGISKIFLQKKTLPDFEGKHIRFVYNSDGELKGEVVVMF
ncbi:hypothetical protein IFM89_010609 [Coptis chinensis]|uniref:RING-type E3 ubiquitin transferase n=1 Tax=Coptis chinensis TaxID=261450 RepID=A0A835IQV5_9MAGN|nr:hypothetical protein IFM89_010609 [Coptis chinensis]